MTECAWIISRISNSAIPRCNPKIMAHAECSQVSSEICGTIPDDLRHIRTVLATCRAGRMRAMCCLNIKNLLSVELLCFIYICIVPCLSYIQFPQNCPELFPKCFLFEHLNWRNQDLFFAWTYLPEYRLIVFWGADHASGSAWGEVYAMWLISLSLSGSREQNWAFPSCWWKSRVETSKGFWQDFSKSCFKLTLPAWIMEPIPYIIKNEWLFKRLMHF